MVSKQKARSKTRKALLAAERQAHAARELRRVERVDRAVLGEDHLVARLHAHDAARVGEQVDQPVELVLLERRHLAALDRVGAAGLEVGAQLLGRELGDVAVAHARADLLMAPSARDGSRDAQLRSAPRMMAASSRGDAVRQRVRDVRLEDRRAPWRAPAPASCVDPVRLPVLAHAPVDERRLRRARACAPWCGRGSGSRRTARSRRSRRARASRRPRGCRGTHCLIMPANSSSMTSCPKSKVMPDSIIPRP